MKIDITSDIVIATDVVTELNYFPIGLLIHNNELYFSLFASGKISKIDVFSINPVVTDIVTGLNGPTDIALNGDDLYISEYSSNKIVKIDIANPFDSLVDVVTGLNGPAGLAFKDNELFIAEDMGNKVSKIDISSLSINEHKSEKSLGLYPNPTNDFISISGLEFEEHYEIFNILGEKVKRGVISNEEEIDISNFQSGFYIFKLEKGNSLKFLKV